MQFPEQIPYSKIKIRPPHRRREWISRPRLLDAIYEELEKQLLLVIAPAGYGKTTLLVDFVHNSELPVCWLSLDVLDQEPQRFLGYFISAIAEQYPDFGKNSFAALETMKSFEQDGEHILIALTNEISEKLDEHFVIVLDDYQIVGDVIIIRQLLSRFLQLASDNVHLILASRSLPDFYDMPRLVIRNLVGGLSYEELAFQPDEIQRLFSGEGHHPLSLPDAQTLAKDSEGWIAAIQLSGGRPGNLSKVDPLKSTRELFDFFSKEILARQPNEIQRFLLMTSFLDTFDVHLCEEVLTPLMDGETVEWSALFSKVRSENLFSIYIDDEGNWMRYHHLFQHFLKSRLRYTEPVLVWHIQQNLARVYEKQEDWEIALQLYDQMDDHENLSRLLVQTGSIFIRSGRVLTLASWLERLTVETIYSQPGILSLYGVVYSTKGEIARALEYFNLAEEKSRTSQDKTDLALVLVRRAEAHRHLGHFDQALADAEETLNLTDGSPASLMKITNGEAQRIIGLAYFGQGKLKNALSWLKDALHTCRVLGLESNIPILETELGVVYRRLGEPDIAARFYESALRAWQDSGNTSWKARLLNNLGLLYHMVGRLEEAYPLLDEALNVATKSGYAWLQANELISLGDLWTDLGDFKTAHECYDQALSIATTLGDSVLIFYATLGETRLKHLRGELLQALSEYKQIETAQVKLGLFEQALLNIERGSCLLKCGETELAIKHLQLATESLDQNQNEMEQASARLWLSVAHYMQDPEMGINEMVKFLPDQSKWENASPLMINASRAGKWLREKTTLPLNNHLIDQFFFKAEQIHQQLPEIRSNLKQNNDQVLQPLELECFTFGDIRVIRNSKLLKSSDWQTREARDLFLFLLQSPPVTKGEIGLAFWPDISPARLKMRFKINIYRIRRALGQDVILFENGEYRFNQELNYKWDREMIDTLVQDAQNSSDRIHLLEQSLSLMQGPYMDDLDAEWVVSDRLKYQDLNQQIMLELAEFYLKNGQLIKSQNLARRILETDSLSEDAHRLMMLGYATLHDPASVTRQYQDYEKMLKEELGIKPSSDLFNLYEELIRNI